MNGFANCFGLRDRSLLDPFLRIIASTEGWESPSGATLCESAREVGKSTPTLAPREIYHEKSVR